MNAVVRFKGVGGKPAGGGHPKGCPPFSCPELLQKMQRLPAISPSRAKCPKVLGSKIGTCTPLGACNFVTILFLAAEKRITKGIGGRDHLTPQGKATHDDP